ncbi:anhydro-N-acetylmuramic acid kinase [Balneatrix alpica]|uniref:Anhydro-N-acetylmuramic acid kinase n=1 Tax=Balneatrix alpica TaxID=75684 RepID=A0ABV5ZBL5_9GAMM|nr:anhydro-N-acetylmuramic acid kinase [Balneatrix alpica]
MYIGLMSGTSLDGVDAIQVDFSASSPQVLHQYSLPYPEDLRRELLALCSSSNDEIERMGNADIMLGRFYADAVIELLRQSQTPTAQIIAIGCHGQTIRHRPDQAQPFSLQIGDPNTLATLTNIPVVADFRRKDMALGGQGAPLVPAFHQHLFAHPQRNRVIVNIGGIANLTLLKQQQVLGFDTGPGNCLLDYWCQLHLHKAYDKAGAWSAVHEVDSDLLQQLMAEPYFQRPYPKSTGRELFNPTWLAAHIKDKNLSAGVIQATLCELSAQSIAQPIRQLCDQADIYLCGGGAFNQDLVRRLTRLLPEYRIEETSALGLPAQWVESCAFAWLAKQYMERMAGNCPAVTGATRPAVLGGLYLPD